MTEPKPCPWCKSSVTVFTAIYGIHGAPDHYAIAHPEDTDCIVDGMETCAYTDREELIRDWNKGIKDAPTDCDEGRICPKCGRVMILCEDEKTYYQTWECDGCGHKEDD